MRFLSLEGYGFWLKIRWLVNVAVNRKLATLRNLMGKLEHYQRGLGLLNPLNRGFRWNLRKSLLMVGDVEMFDGGLAPCRFFRHGAITDPLIEPDDCVAELV